MHTFAVSDIVTVTWPDGHTQAAEVMAIWFDAITVDFSVLSIDTPRGPWTRLVIDISSQWYAEDDPSTPVRVSATDDAEVEV